MSKQSDLPARFATGIALIAAACLLVFYGDWENGGTLGAWIFRIVVAAIAGLMLVEWNIMHRLPRGWSHAVGALFGLLLIVLAAWIFPVDETDVYLAPDSFLPALLPFAALAGAALIASLAARSTAPGVGIVYVGIPAYALMVLEWAYMGLVFWVMIVTWATDIGAYFAGRAIGGPKLAPRVSPNKTWAGLIGGAAAALALGWIAAWFFELGSPFLWLGAPMAVLAQAGDLFESWIKRRAGVKDSGAILPGHGGLLDRLDGLLPVALATLLLLMAGFWTL
jgi:phosphatidate cytidylyltransferase